MSIVYYSPNYLSSIAAERDDSTLLDWTEFFNVSKASLIDRTGTIQTPFPTLSLYAIPSPDKTASFDELCIDRAGEILDEGLPIVLMYSGGLDSTTVLVAFHEAIKRRGNGSFGQISIATSGEAIAENPTAWWDIVIPYYKVISASDMLKNVSLDTTRYVQGENADQLFGSDRVFQDLSLINQEYSVDNLKTFLSSKLERKNSLDFFMDGLTGLVAKSPLDVKLMRDFFWWLNFTCKWQCVSLRTLSFTNVFDDSKSVSLAEFSRFESFFNTIPFQQIATNGSLDKWGDTASPFTYKHAARKFILKYHPKWTEYVEQKVKVGSLYHVIRQRQTDSTALSLTGNILKSTTL